MDEKEEVFRAASYELFFWFSRFEFALKRNHYLENEDPGAKAKPGWNRFVEDHQAQYLASDEAKRLVEMKPKGQFVGQDKTLEWAVLNDDPNQSDLGVVVSNLRVVRNNLFHGGKHTDQELNDVNRNLELVRLGKELLDQLAQLGSLWSDYSANY